MEMPEIMVIPGLDNTPPIISNMPKIMITKAIRNEGLEIVHVDRILLYKL